MRFQLGQRVRVCAALKRERMVDENRMRRWYREPLPEPVDGIVVREVTRYDGRVTTETDWDGESLFGRPETWNEWRSTKAHRCVEVAFDVRRKPITVLAEDVEVVR